MTTQHEEHPDYSAEPSPHTQVDDQLGGYEQADSSRRHEDSDDFGYEHQRPTFSEEQSDRPGMEADIEAPRGLAGMDDRD
jgi:hypothetical protein